MRILCWGVVLILLASCATFRSYNQELASTVTALQYGQPEVALAILEKNNQEEEKDLLYWLEKGAILRLMGQLADSEAAWRLADERIEQQQEGTALAGVGAVLLNDRLLPYGSYDHEKVLVTTELALTHLLQGDWAKARVAIQKTHERETRIALQREKETVQVEEEARARQVSVSWKDLKGYPVEVLDAPEVVALRNGFHNAFAHYLAGFIFEALGEVSLAAPGYRQAIELRPHQPLLEQSLAELESRMAQKKTRKAAGLADVLFVVASGLAPGRESFMTHLPVPMGQGWGIVSFAVPVIRPYGQPPPRQLTIAGGPQVALTSITSIDVLSRRGLRDDMPGILLRNVVRATAKTAMQVQTQDRRNPWLGLVTSLASVATEGADERSWRTLPADVTIGRALLPEGEVLLELGAWRSRPLTLRGSHQVVLLRQVGPTLYLAVSPPVPHRDQER